MHWFCISDCVGSLDFTSMQRKQWTWSLSFPSTSSFFLAIRTQPCSRLLLSLFMTSRKQKNNVFGCFVQLYFRLPLGGANVPLGVRIQHFENHCIIEKWIDGWTTFLTCLCNVELHEWSFFFSSSVSRVASTGKSLWRLTWWQHFWRRGFQLT